MDSSFGSLQMQTFKKLPIIAPNMIEINVSIPCAPILRSNYGTKYQIYGTMECWNNGILCEN